MEHYRLMDDVFLGDEDMCGIYSRISFIEGNILKYLARYSLKDGEGDLDKALVYVGMLERSGMYLSLDMRYLGERLAFNKNAVLCSLRSVILKLGKCDYDGVRAMIEEMRREYRVVGGSDYRAE